MDMDTVFNSAIGLALLGVVSKLYFDYLARKAGEGFGEAVKWLLDHSDDKTDAWILQGVKILEEKIGDDISEDTKEIKETVEGMVKHIPVGKMFPQFFVKTAVIILKAVDAKAKELRSKP